MNPLAIGLAAIGARIAPIVARVVSSTTWLSLGWVASDIINVINKKQPDAEGYEETAETWKLFTGGGVLVGMVAMALLYKPISKLFRK